MKARLRQFARDHMPAAAKRRSQRWSARSSHAERAELAQRHQFAVDAQRVYFFHVRKCAGTSLIHGILGADGGDGPAAYRLLTGSEQGWIEDRGRVIVGWNTHLLEEGAYHFGFSHVAQHEVDVPPGTFTVTCLRDPAKRVLSHYRMLMHFAANEPDAYALRSEGRLIGKGFSTFLDRLPREHLQRQLYMFSRHFDVGEAADRITALDLVLWVEQFAAGLDGLQAQLGITMPRYHEKRYDIDIDVSDAEHARLREMLAPEYDLMARIARP